MRPLKLTKKQCVKDEQVLAAIIAAKHACGRDVQPANPHDGQRGSGNGFGLRSNQVDGPCCAVGAGVLYRGLEFNDYSDPIYVFAEAYEVSPEYAMGVSLGFEFEMAHDVDLEKKDYQRGFEVGKAAFEILCMDGGAS